MQCVCLCPTDSEIKSSLDIADGSSVEMVMSSAVLGTCCLLMEMLMLL